MLLPYFQPSLNHFERYVQLRNPEIMAHSSEPDTTECQNLVQFCERVKRRFWPDWDSLCQRECMKGHFGLDKTSLDWKSAAES